MPAIFHVDQARTFRGTMFMSSAPKTVFGNNAQQDKTADGTPKWEVQIVASFDQFGKIENEIIKVGVASFTDPGDALNQMPQPVELVNFRVGVSPVEKRQDKNGREQITGGKAWYQADEIRAINTVPPQAAKKTQDA